MSTIASRAVAVERGGLAAACLGGCLLATVAAPFVVLLIAPLLLGVAHLLAEFRVIARRLGSLPLQAWAIALPLGAMIALRAAEFAGMARPAASDVVCGCLAVVAALAVAPRASSRSRMVFVLAGCVLSGIAIGAWRTTSLVMAHAHNVVALVLLTSLADDDATRRTASRVVWAVTLGSLLILCGAFDALVQTTPLATSTEFATRLREALAPGLDATLGTRVVLVYTFAQLVHYAIWLILLPLALVNSLPRSAEHRAPRMNVWRAIGLPLAIASVVAVPLWAWLSDPTMIRDRYLALAGFHAWLELAAIAYAGLTLRGHAFRGD